MSVDVPVTVIDGPDELSSAVGRHLGRSPWTTVSPERVHLFMSAVSGVDEPDDEPTAVPLDLVPGLLALALTNQFLPEIVEVRGFSMGVNTGTGRITFGPSAPVGSRLRGAAELVSVTPLTDGSGHDTVMRVTVERDDGVDPSPCVVDARSRWII
ncbi:MAG: MaoC family dehydratase [Ilumatobacteraceae bacterium]